MFEHHAAVEAGAANRKVVGRPFTAFVLPPGLAQPFAVGLEAASRQHAGFGGDALRTHPGRHKAAIVKLQPVHRAVVADLHAEFFCAAVISVDQRFAAAHEKGVGAAQVQGA